MSRTQRRSGIVGGEGPRTGLTLLTLFLLVVGQFPRLLPREARGQSPAKTSNAAKDSINPDGYTSARVCGQCHVDIYNSWKNSLHAFSLTDPIFDAAYMQAIKIGGEEAKRVCLRCHAPMTQFNNDFDLTEAVTTEGVSCDFCHTVTAVHIDNPEQPYSIEPGLVKRSVLRKAASPAHQVAYSALHGKAEFCGGCHNYAAAGGALIMGTYQEWLSGPYPAEGIQCQDCHMVLSAGHVVSETIKKGNGEFHLHDLIHDTEQLRNALSVEIVRTERTSQGLRVEVKVKNVGSGHMVPTGLPSRQVLLTVTAEVGGRTFSQERRYRKVVADEKGRVLNTDHEMLLFGAKVLNDTRIGPREERKEILSLAVPEKGRANLTATVTYVYTPMVLEQRRLNIKMAQVDKVIQ